MRSLWKYLACSIPVMALILSLACTSKDSDEPSVPQVNETGLPTKQPLSSEVAEMTRIGPLKLASDEFNLPAALSFDAPGFHEVLTETGVLPGDLGPSAGMRLILALRDAGASEISCDREHPLSGCATVDWSDAEGFRNVQPGGVFVNSLTVHLVSGERTFYLSESGSLNDAPDAFDPG